MLAKEQSDPGMTYSRFTTDEVVEAYRTTGSVWKAGRKLGLSGQMVHGRLRTIGYRPGSAWDDEEVERLRELVGQATIGQIADELGRSYAAIACKINELGTGSRHGNRIKKKLPRGVGLDKVSIKRHIRDLESSGQAITRYARQHGMRVETLIRAIEHHFPDWWVEYRKGISYLPEAICPHCEEMFHPSNTRQEFCSRRCGERYRTDQNYFGGKRKDTIGLAEGICQICGRAPKKGLSAHHVLGKENDPDNEWLVALCSGCHNMVTALGLRDFTEEQWEALISFAWLRRNGAVRFAEVNTIHVCVDIDAYFEDEDE
jgi:5-methylcytosine-specific restriction endonuclease McrA